MLIRVGTRVHRAFNPKPVLGDAIGCLIYSFLCLIANSLLVWLIWTHNERKTYIAFIAYFTLIATYSSIIQQLYDYIFWRDVMVAQYYYGKDHADDAEVQYQKGIFGLKLVLSYIRIFAFTVESTLVFFFSFSLTATVYGWWAKKPKALRILSITGRIVPITLAVIMIILLQLDFTHADFMVYMAIANAQFLLSLVGACIFLLMILFKYMQTRRLLKTWDGVQYGKGGTSTATSGMRSLRSRANSNRNRPTNGSFDNWLVIRLSIAFVMLCVFEYTNVGPRLTAKGHVVESAYKPEPDTSHKRALSSVRGYLSGVSPSLLAFIVFGTTKTFQKKMYRAFVPRFLRKGSRADDDDDMFRCRTPAQLPSSRYSSTVRASSTTLPPPPSTATTYVNSTRSLSHQDSSLSMRKPEPAALLSTIPDEPDDFAEVDPRFPRRSQIGMALSKLPTPPRVDDGYGCSGSWQDSSNNGPYSPKAPIYSSIRSHSRNESLPSPRPHSRHHSFSRPTSRSVDHGQPPPPTTPRLPTHSIELSRGRSRSRSRSRVRTGAFSRDASHDSSSSRVPMSRFNSLAGGGGGSIRGRTAAAETIIDDGASSAGASMTTIWSDSPRRGSKHSRI
ncbi:hypothetical protein INS49_005838 [Diaporthe citri]|uniref:uncharacterized protein n=1 Tax=Diaporthe citri TaxID=83186 RepID=UPI001C809435|nr:uncharacterized protein INS49_005838 [Diaporthe citri]KAG6364239.1 hypothetical protein INS49_005838 [Diaporthe citri]